MCEGKKTKQEKMLGCRWKRPKRWETRSKLRKYKLRGSKHVETEAASQAKDCDGDG